MFTKLIKIIKFLLKTIIVKPIKLITKAVIKPFTFICINLGNINKKVLQILSKFTIGKIKLPKFSKNQEIKKDFTEKGRI